MVAQLRLRTHELLYEEIGNLIAEILSAWQKAECYHPPWIFNWILKKLFFGGFYIHDESKIVIINRSKDMLRYF